MVMEIDSSRSSASGAHSQVVLYPGLFIFSDTRADLSQWSLQAAILMLKLRWYAAFVI